MPGSAYLRREAPELEVVAKRDYEIDFRGPAGAEGTLRLDRLFAQGTEVPVGDTAAKQALPDRSTSCPDCFRKGKNSPPRSPTSMLVLLKPPAAGDWASLRTVSRAAAGDRLWPEPLRLTRAGIFPV